MTWTKLSNLLLRQCKSRRSVSTCDESMVSNSAVIVPLYVYPDPGSWDFLHESIQKYDRLHFVIIVNPFNGPGPDTLPDTNYLREIPRLTSYRNVDVIGYVHTTFTQRDISTVIDDIHTYSKWAEQARYPGLGVKGIFVDETPNQYSVCAQEYLGELNRFAKSCKGFGNKRLLIHNPGCIPSPAYMNLADITVIFEDTWQTFEARQNAGLFDLQKLSNPSADAQGITIGRDQLAVMIHSVPKDLGLECARKVVERAKQTADIVFVTDLDVDYYSNRSHRWTEWIGLLAEG